MYLVDSPEHQKVVLNTLQGKLGRLRAFSPDWQVPHLPALSLSPRICSPWPRGHVALCLCHWAVAHPTWVFGDGGHGGINSFLEKKTYLPKMLKAGIRFCILLILVINLYDNNKKHRPKPSYWKTKWLSDTTTSTDFSLMFKNCY